MTIDSSRNIVDCIEIPHTAFANAKQRIERCFEFSTRKSEAEGLAVIGESGTGKTSVLRSFRRKHRPMRDDSGLNVPILSATVPSMPTVKSLAEVLLAAIGDPAPGRGTENEKSRRLRTLMVNTGTRMVMIDEFQHFYDRGKRRIMHHVADWLKVLIDDTKSTLVVAGLPSCRAVIDQNEQLARRFLAPIQLSRFDWGSDDQREDFLAIMEAFSEGIRSKYKIPDLHSEDMALRFYCATGGLIGLVSKLLRYAVEAVATEKRTSVRLEDLHMAHVQSIWTDPAMPKSFERSFRLMATKDLIAQVRKIGVMAADVHGSTGQATKPRRVESANSFLVGR
jgi:hypothetical protein